jgi:hypothetical protein
VLGGLSCREYEAAEAVPEAFGLARSSVSRRFIRASVKEFRRLQERRLDDAEWLVLVIDGKSFADDQIVMAVGVTVTGEKRIRDRAHGHREQARDRKLAEGTRVAPEASSRLRSHDARRRQAGAGEAASRTPAAE